MAFLLHLFGLRNIFHIVLVHHQLQSWLDFHELLLHQYVTHKKPECSEMQISISWTKPGKY